MLRTYQDAVAVITGGGSGLGLALGRELLARGAGRVVLADIRPEAADAAAKELGPKAHPAALDVRDLDACRSLVAREPRIDYFFNNAGTGFLGTAERHLPEDWTLTLGVNLFGVVNGVQAVYPKMIAQGFGHIVNTSSVLGLIPLPMVSAYVTSKHAVVGLSRALRFEAAHHGVRVSVLCPGVVRTPLLNGGAFGAVRSAQKVDPAKIMTWGGRLTPMEPEYFARKTLDLVAKNREVVVVPPSLGFVAWLCRAFPSLERAVLADQLKKARVRMPEMFTESPAASPATVPSPPGSP